MVLEARIELHRINSGNNVLWLSVARRPYLHYAYESRLVLTISAIIRNKSEKCCE